jgi:hypothetical protein
MKRFNLNPVVRSLFVVGGVAILATGATWAAFSAQTTLAASTMSSVTASLKIKSTNSTWGDTAPGFTIKNLLPGTGVTEYVYFRNAGSVNLALSAHVPNQPATAVGGNGFTGWKNVLINITGESCGATVQTTLAALLTATPIALPCGPLPAGDAGNPNMTGYIGNYSVHFDINQAAITGNHAGVGSFDIQFTGNQS